MKLASIEVSLMTSSEATLNEASKVVNHFSLGASLEALGGGFWHQHENLERLQAKFFWFD